ncbi:MAG TPA: response regulator [Fimbriimonas sp.]|nr:response regulator [Fimbriimonas sp.]
MLVVEDDVNDEHLTLRALRQSGVHCSVVVAHNGADALHFLRRTGPFDGRVGSDPIAIFVDNTLPGYGGVDLVTAIRAIPEFNGVPVVILSGCSDLNVVHKCSMAGANSFLEKPIDMADYIRQIGAAAQYWLNLNLSGPQLANAATAM